MESQALLLHLVQGTLCGSDINQISSANGILVDLTNGARGAGSAKPSSSGVSTKDAEVDL
jgi:hypothetical protein